MSIDPEPTGVSPATHAHRWAMLAGAWLLYFSFGLMIAAMAPLVRPIAEEFGLSYSAMGAVLGAWPLVYIVSAIPCGAVLDRVGLRRSLFASAVIMAFSGLLRAVASSDLSLFLAVAIFGLGGPLVSIGGPKLVIQWFEGKERGLAMGVFSTGPPLGGICAFALTNSIFMPLAGGSWRIVLAGYSGFVFASAAVWLGITAHHASRAVESQIAAEPKQSQFTVFVDLVRVRSLRTILLMSVGIFFFNQALNNWLPEILRNGGMDAASAGYWASIPIAVGIAASLSMPHFAVPSRRLATLAFLFVCAGTATLLIATYADGVGLAAGLVLQGIARGAMRPILVLVLIEIREVGPRRAGAAGGLFFSTAEIGGVLGPLTVGYLFDATSGFLAALHVLTATCAILVLLVVRLWQLTR